MTATAETVVRDHKTLADLAQFAELEVRTGDLEPWADLLHHLHVTGELGREQALWVLTLYNTYDDLGKAWQVFHRWPSPRAWSLAPDRADVVQYRCAQERRNLHGGRVLKRFDSYVAALDGRTQERWMRLALTEGTPHGNFVALTRHLRRVWGVGRQAAFEWAEFVGKVTGFDVSAPDAQLWESEGPRRSLQRLYGNPRPTAEWLDERATECRASLTDVLGVPMPWEDFETVICDFNVMRDGRYYPGKHLGMLRSEIDDIPPAHRDLVLTAWHRVIPHPWSGIAPGVDKTKQTVYRDTGRMVTAP